MITAIESLSGSRSRAHMSGAPISLSLDEIDALQDGYSSDASTVILDETPRSPVEPPVPEWSPTSAATIDPMLGLAEPIIVSQVDPRAGHDMSNPFDRIIRRERDRMQLMQSQTDPVARAHLMDLFDIHYHLHQLCEYVKNQVPALRHLPRLAPGPGESVHHHLGMSLPGPTVSNICYLLEQLSWIVGERAAVQREAGSHKTDYLAIYRSHFAGRMDLSVFDLPPRRFPKTPRRGYVSSYRRSLGSLRYVGHVRAVRGRIPRRYKLIQRKRVGNAVRTEISASHCFRLKSPEI